MYYFVATEMEVRTSTTTNIWGDEMGYGLVAGVTTAYIQHKDGTREALLPPDARVGPLSSIGGAPVTGYYVSSFAINNKGIAAGYFTENSTGRVRGFVYNKGQYEIVDGPNAERTWIQFIADDNSLVGKFQPVGGVEQRFGASTTVPFSGAPLADYYAVSDRSFSTDRLDHGTWYHGPVSWLDNEIILGDHNMNVLGLLPNVFIHTGSGDDAIEVSSGRNIVDGGNGSNFLTGGSGHDEFYVDLRARDADVWSTIERFSKGDVATIWGAGDLTMTKYEQQGAIGHKGLTFSMTAPGRTAANLTLAGYTGSDRLDIRYGRSVDLPGLPGSDYMQIVAL